MKHMDVDFRCVKTCYYKLQLINLHLAPVGSKNTQRDRTIGIYWNPPPAYVRPCPLLEPLTSQLDVFLNDPLSPYIYDIST